MKKNWRTIVSISRTRSRKMQLCRNLRKVYQRRATVGRLNRINVYVPSRLVNFFILLITIYRKINIQTEVYECSIRIRIEVETKETIELTDTRAPLAHSNDYSRSNFVYFRWYVIVTEIVRFCLRKITILRKLGRGARAVSVSLLRLYPFISNILEYKYTFASNVFQWKYEVTIKLSMFIVGTMWRPAFISFFFHIGN